MNVKLHFILIVLVLLMGCAVSSKKECSIKDLSGKCKSELEVYQDSLRLGKENILDIPVSIREIRRNGNLVYDGKVPNKNIGLANRNGYRTWIAEHVGEDEVLVGAHYIYWGHEQDESWASTSNFVSKNTLGPVEG